MKAYNFSAGPAILPESVLKTAAKAVQSFDPNGLSILEVSHRSKEIVAVLDEAVHLIKSLIGIKDTHDVLFLTGGASSQFFMTAMNCLNTNEKAAYINTGTWSAKAIKEAMLFGEVLEIASSKNDNFSYIPKDYTVPSNAKYLHYTSNNTIFGTQFHNVPNTDIPLVCDMSSDFLSRPVDIEKYGIIYAGAQKNLGPAGVTIVIVRKDMLGKVERTIPTMLDYRTHIKKESSFNTPPVFPIYVCMLTLRWLQEQGGLGAISDYNDKKGALIYDEIDRNSLFVGTANKEDRSLMNATFLLKDETLNGAFLAACDAAHISGIKGHRSVGGFRASIYNAMTIEGVQTLVEIMKTFEKKHA